MKQLQFTESNFEKLLREVTETSSLFDLEIEKRTRAITEAVAADGDSALIRFTQQFDCKIFLERSRCPLSNEAR